MAGLGSNRHQVSVTLCTSSYEYNIQGLLDHLRDLQRQLPHLIKNVTYHQLPYNNIDNYKFAKGIHVDVMILCHSIANRRFALTDVADACYNKFLPNCKKLLGKEKIAVIAHDFDNVNDQDLQDRIANFRLQQPKTFDSAGLVLICGKLVEGKEFPEPSKAQLLAFLTRASEQPEEMKTGGVSSFLKKFESCSSGQAIAITSPHNPAQYPGPQTGQYAGHQPGQQSHSQPPLRLPTQHLAQHHQQLPAQQSPSLPIYVSVCTSSYEQNIEGLIFWLRKLKTDHPRLIADIRLRSLPYNDIDSFKFPSSDPVDVMVLCHSVRNRGFSITDVVNSIYDKYLKHCSKEIGKKKLAVIVHDISEWNPGVVRGRMDTFQKTQPSTFRLVDTVIIGGSLEKPDKFEISEVDMSRLFYFFESASLVPRKKMSIFGKVF
ncbi:uncharacterized protein LOC115918591 [Strongylocentrotus purpuratus]|uniref:Uncharacterized protein n=1 Tax=Strongylocentrotus purpuratus TaxID=7668 RepID=A0A7M7NR98_STRPU|nr:uncharacterized protein LOC115918591 [Strongylocentrotus purpuratus]